LSVIPTLRPESARIDGRTPANVKDYLIDQAGFDWQAMLAGWADILAETFTMWLVNRFGEVFIIGEDSSVHHLDIAGGTLHRAADTREQFADLIDVPQNANNWLMIPLVDQCVNWYVAFTGQCYGFKIPPLLGGAYEPRNVAPVDLVENFLADIWSQAKDLPEGSPVKPVIGPRLEHR
jgi:hypothetical protein